MRWFFGDLWKLSAQLSFWFYRCCCCCTTSYLGSTFHCNTIVFKLKLNCSRISSVGRVLDWRAGGCLFDFRGWTNTLGLKITEKWRYYLCPAANGFSLIPFPFCSCILRTPSVIYYMLSFHPLQNSLKTIVREGKKIYKNIIKN